jgi:RNA polymerase sigma-70 factor (sigma-E family)
VIFGVTTSFAATRRQSGREREDQATFVSGSAYLEGDGSHKGIAMRSSRYDGLDEYVALRGTRLLRTAILLTGSREAGEDLVQQALERLVRHWSRIEGDPEGYLRRTMARLAIDRWRWRSRRGELLGLDLAADPGSGDATATLDLRDALMRALATLPPRQRAVVVLRHWEQLSEAETAGVLGCSVGTVKSASSRGLAALRSVVETQALATTNFHERRNS